MQRIIAAALVAGVSSIGVLATPVGAVAAPTSQSTLATHAVPAAPETICNFKVTAYPSLYTRSGPGTNYPTAGPPIKYGTIVSGNCTPTNGFYFIRNPGDNTYHWGNGTYLIEE